MDGLYINAPKLTEAADNQRGEIPGPRRVHLKGMYAGCKAEEEAEDECSSHRRLVSVK